VVVPYLVSELVWHFVNCLRTKQVPAGSTELGGGALDSKGQLS
jgi:hypothetical protein